MAVLERLGVRAPAFCARFNSCRKYCDIVIDNMQQTNVDSGALISVRLDANVHRGGFREHLQNWKITAVV
eukprot:s82_g8.t1